MVSRDADKPEPGPGPAQPNPAPLRLVGGPRPPRHLGPRRPAALQAPPPGVSSGPDVKSMIRALRRRWLLASSVGVLAALVVGIGLLILVPQKFNAFATLQITAFQDYITGKPPVHADHNIMRKTQETRFKGQDVLIKAVSDDKVRNLGIMRKFPSAREAITWLQEDLKVDTQENNEIMTITLPGDDAEELVVVVDALTRAYLFIINGKERGQREEKVKKLQEIANQTKEKLKEKITFRDSKAKGMAAGSVGCTSSKVTRCSSSRKRAACGPPRNLRRPSSGPNSRASRLASEYPTPRTSPKAPWCRSWRRNRPSGRSCSSSATS